MTRERIAIILLENLYIAGGECELDFSHHMYVLLGFQSLPRGERYRFGAVWLARKSHTLVLS